MADRKWPSGLRIKTASRALGCGSPIDHTRAGQGFSRLHLPENCAALRALDLCYAAEEVLRGRPCTTALGNRGASDPELTIKDTGALR
jgi:hypothetical protein